MEIVLYFICGLIILLGLVGTIMPMLPGVPLVFLGTAILAFYTQFEIISEITLVIFLLFTILSLVIDYLSGLVGAKYSGASLYGSLGALAGAIIGVIYFGLIGLILAPAIFVLIFELMAKKTIKKSAKSASYTLLSTVLGMILNGLIALTMPVVLLVAIFI